jgi:BRCT domain type II-containing protein
VILLSLKRQYNEFTYKKGVTQNPRDADQGIRRSTRTIKKHLGDHTRKTESHQTKRYISSKDTNMPKIMKSASSIEKQRLDILPNPKKANPTVTKSHQDSHSNYSKASAKASFWGSPDISSGIENLFEVMGLYNKSKTLIISMHLCSIKNIIQIS